MKVSVLFILLLFYTAGPIRHDGSEQTSFSSAGLLADQPLSTSGSVNHHLGYEIIQAPGNTYGYKIYRSGHLFIYQPHRPALQGQQGFATEADARKVARFVLFKIKRGEIPPSVSVEELNSLHVVD